MPDEIRRLPKDKAILLIRGAKPLMLNKITPEEHPSFRLLKYCKASEHMPEWRQKQNINTGGKTSQEYVLHFDDTSDGSEDDCEFDLSGGIDCSTLKEIEGKDL